MSFLKSMFANMPSIRKRRVQLEESTKTNGSKRLKSGKMKKCSSSSESESGDNTPKNKINPKKQTIKRKSLEDRKLKTNEGTEQSKEKSSENLGTNHSSDSDKLPLVVVHEDSDNDLINVQNFMKENFKSSNSSSLKSKRDIPGVKSNSKSKSPQKNGETTKSDEGIEIKKKLFNNPKVDNSDSDSDIPGTQETIKKVNHSKNLQTEMDVKKKSNITSSESDSDHEEKMQTVITGDVKKDEISKKNPIENSSADHFESDTDVGGTQKTVNTANHDKNVKTTLNTSKKLNLIDSESESDSEEKQKTIGEFKTNSKPTTIVNENSNTAISESEPDIERSQKTVNVRKNRNEDLKIDASTNAKLTTALQSESDLKEKHENMTIDVQKEPNLNTAETEIGEEVAKDLKNTCDLPIVNYDLEMLSHLKEKKCSDSSDFELSLEIDSSHEETEQENGDTGKPKISNRDLQKKSRLFRKKTFRSNKRIPTPPPKMKQEPEVSSNDSAEEEDLNEMGVSFNYTSYKPTEEERLKLANMIVKLRYPVRPQHKIESTAGTRTMTENEREEFEQHATLKHGYFSPEEDKQIKKNWKTFCRDNDWDPKKPQPFLFMKHKNKVFLLNQHSRRKFMQGLAHGLDNRCLYSVFQRFKILFEPHRTCRYESDEDRTILDYVAAYEKKKMEDRKNDVNEKDRKFAELAIMLRRTRASIWRRYRVLKKKAGQESKDNFCHSNK